MRNLKFYYFIGFFILVLSISVATLFLEISYEKAKYEIRKILLKRMLTQVSTIVKNYKTYLLNVLPKDKDWYEYLKSNPNLRKQIQYYMSIGATKNIKYIYLLGIKDKKFIFLIDASKEDKAEFGEIFEPLNKKEYKILKSHYFFDKKLKDIYLTYVSPIIINKQVKGILVVDISANILSFIKSILEELAKSVYLIIFFSLSFIVLLLFFAYFDYKREKELIKKREELEKLNAQLQQINKKLEIKVKEKIEEIRKKDAIILNQSKLASLGEMLNMIAHQWRQPLNSLSASAITIELKTQMNQLKEEECKNFAKYVQNQTQQLSEIIDDFMNFSKPDREKEEFLLKNLIEDIMKIVGVQLKNRNIKVDIDIDENLKLNSYKKELSHVLLNIISNARDALKSKKNSKIIKISSKEDEDYIYLIIEDNAGGIPQEIKDRIFEPYFTTKGPKGVGLGLYMSKKIIEERLNGTIDFENTKSGAKFIIKLKKEKG